MDPRLRGSQGGATGVLADGEFRDGLTCVLVN